MAVSFMTRCVSVYSILVRHDFLLVLKFPGASAARRDYAKFDVPAGD
jgi:hypothetical protein